MNRNRFWINRNENEMIKIVKKRRRKRVSEEPSNVLSILSAILEEMRNVTCYQCSGELCGDPLKGDQSTPTVLCEYNCWVRI